MDDALKKIDRVGLGLPGEVKARVFAVGNTAFARVGLYRLIENLEIVCIRETADLGSIRRKVQVKSLERDFGNPSVAKYNTSELLSKPRVGEYLKSFGGRKYVFVYKSSPGIERMAVELGLTVLSSPSRVRKQFEDKWSFRPLAMLAGVRVPSGEQMKLDELDEAKFGELQKRLGERLVFQLTDYNIGGGIGTFFVSERGAFEEFWGYVRRRRADGKELVGVNVTAFIQGEAVSMVACVTGHGVLVGPLQRQLVDLREVVGFYGRSGVFAGHEWGEIYSKDLERRAAGEVQKLGEFMRGKGYKGIFGVDMVVGRESGQVTVVECNSRYTGAFPVFTMLQEEVGEIPMDWWHLLEFLGVEYEMDFKLVQESYRRPKVGAQLILHNLTRAFVEVGGEVKPGVYSYACGNLEYLRSGFELSDIKGEDEMVLTDGVPYRGGVYKPGYRIGRLLFKQGVTEGNGGKLKSEVVGAIEKLYGLYDLRKTEKRG